MFFRKIKCFLSQKTPNNLKNKLQVKYNESDEYLLGIHNEYYEYYEIDELLSEIEGDKEINSIYDYIYSKNIGKLKSSAY